MWLHSLAALVMGLPVVAATLPGDAHAEAARSARAELLAEVKRAPSDLQRRPDGLEEVEAALRGKSLPAWPTALAFHPDGSQVALADETGAVDLWRWSAKSHIRLSIRAGYFSDVAFSPDGTTLITADGERGASVRTWDPKTGILKATFGQDADLDSFDWEGAPRFWQTANDLIAFLPLEQLPGVEEGLDANGRVKPGLDRLPDGNLFQVVRSNNVIHRWSAPKPFSAILFNADRRWVALIDNGESGLPRDPYQRAVVRNYKYVDAVGWRQAAASVLKKKAIVEVYELDSAKKRASFRLRLQHVWLSVPLHGNTIVTSTERRPHESGGLYLYGDPSGTPSIWDSEIWDASTGKRLGSVRGRPSGLQAALMSPPGPATASADGRWLLFSQGSDHVVWDTDQHRVGHSFRFAGYVEFVPGTNLLLQFRQQGKMLQTEVWDLVTLRKISFKDAIAAGDPDAATSRYGLRPPHIAFSSKRGLLAVWQFTYESGGCGGYYVSGPEGDQTVRLWNLHTGEPWTELGGHETPVRFVAFSADGGLVATADGNANLKVWRVATPKD